MKPTLSVVMSVFNGGRYLKEAIDSILNQSFKDFELIIINDGSTDDSLSTIKSFQDKRIKIINQNNQGLIASLNTGLKLAIGEFIARHDADDVSDLRRFEKQLNFFSDNTDIYFLGSSANIIDEFGDKIDNIISQEIVTTEQFFSYCPFVHGSVMFKRTILDDFEIWYNKDMLYIEDYDFFWRIFNQFKCKNINEPLYSWRFHKESISVKRIALQVKNVFLRRELEKGKIRTMSQKELNFFSRLKLNAKIQNNIIHIDLKNKPLRIYSLRYLFISIKYFSLKSLLFSSLSLINPKLLIHMLGQRK